jgi:hypothetical protein
MKRHLTEAHMPTGKMLATFEFQNVSMVASSPVLYLLQSLRNNLRAPALKHINAKLVECRVIFF